MVGRLEGREDGRLVGWYVCGAGDTVGCDSAGASVGSPEGSDVGCSTTKMPTVGSDVGWDDGKDEPGVGGSGGAETVGGRKLDGLGDVVNELGDCG